MKLLPPTQAERDRLSRVCFFLALAWFILGFVVDLARGDWWFFAAACLFLFVFLISAGNDYRIAAALFLFVSLLFALFFHFGGAY